MVVVVVVVGEAGGKKDNGNARAREQQVHRADVIWYTFDLGLALSLSLSLRRIKVVLAPD